MSPPRLEHEPVLDAPRPDRALSRARRRDINKWLRQFAGADMRIAGAAVRKS
jgi:hypothetical protein